MALNQINMFVEPNPDDLRPGSSSAQVMFRRGSSKRLFRNPVARISIDEGRKQALKLLNHKEPQHIPDVYFVRRSPNHLVEYLGFDETKLNSIADRVSDG